MLASLVPFHEEDGGLGWRVETAKDVERGVHVEVVAGVKAMVVAKEPAKAMAMGVAWAAGREPCFPSMVASNLGWARCVWAVAVGHPTVSTLAPTAVKVRPAPPARCELPMAV